MALTATDARSQIESITIGLIEASLCNHQNFPVLKQHGVDDFEVTFGGASGFSAALKSVPYKDIYDEFERKGDYNLKLLDGALLQMSYRFSAGALMSHRLAFFPSPYLEQFQNDPELYELDDIYSEILNRSVVAVPVRFDFDASDGVFEELHHPKSHLTLGEYTNCRIPVCSPLEPVQFVEFILRSFYNTAHRRCSEALPPAHSMFDRCISSAEEAVVHVAINPRPVVTTPDSDPCNPVQAQGECEVDGAQA